jgi:nucleotide-binding universal stress UspA family protein
MPDRPLLLCYDGSDDAKHAIDQAARLFPGAETLVLSVSESVQALPALAWAPGPVVGAQDLFTAMREAAQKMAEEGARLASDAGLEATPLAVDAEGPVWAAIVETAAARDVAAIVIGSRGLSGVRSLLLGSVSSGVVHHAREPTVVVRRPDDLSRA